MKFLHSKMCRCQEACLAHHDVSKKKFEEEVRAKFQKEKSENNEAVDEDLRSARLSVEDAQTELNHVKELYVNVCTEKDVLEDKLSQEFESRLGEEVIKVSGWRRH